MLIGVRKRTSCALVTHIAPLRTAPHCRTMTMHIHTAQVVTKSLNQLKLSTIERYPYGVVPCRVVPFDGSRFQLVKPLGHCLGRANIPSVGYFRVQGVHSVSIYLVCTSNQSDSPSQGIKQGRPTKPPPSAKQGVLLDQTHVCQICQSLY
jgi:hypothetical protein